MKSCRTCLVQITGNNSLDIGAKVVDEMDVVQAIRDVASVPTSHDDLLPKFICKKCFKLLKSTTDFRRMIVDSYNELLKRLNTDREFSRDEKDVVKVEW